MLSCKCALIIVLLFYILFGFFTRPSKQIRRYSPVVILIILCCISLNIYTNDVLLSVMFVTIGIVFIYSLENDVTDVTESFYKNDTNDTNDTNDSNRGKPYDTNLEHVKHRCSSPPPSDIVNHTIQQSRHMKDLRTQSNIFNKLNNDLYYNELGEQYNIQGVDSDINGYDRTIYV